MNVMHAAMFLSSNQTTDVISIVTQHMYQKNTKYKKKFTKRCHQTSMHARARGLVIDRLSLSRPCPTLADPCPPLLTLANPCRPLMTPANPC